MNSVPTGRRLRRSRTMACAALGLLACPLVLAGCGGSDSPAASSPRYPSLETMGLNTPFVVPGIRQPHMIPAADAQLADETRVIGITDGTVSRAYAVNALSGMTSHVINDLVQDVPVSITYCDQTDCARVFTTGEHGATIDLWMMGFVDGQLSLRFQDRQYSQTSKELPLEDYPFTLTTWKEWRDAHCDTDVYIGGGPPDLPEVSDLPFPPVTVRPDDQPEPSDRPQDDQSGGEFPDRPPADTR